MEHFTHCPIPGKGGSDCWRESHPASRFGLCATHWRDVVSDWCADQPTTTIRCRECGVLNTVDTADLAAAYCSSCNFDISVVQLISDRPELETAIASTRVAFPGVVYYILFGDRVKIGYSSDLSGRLLALPYDEVLAAEPGSISLEKSRHRSFESIRLRGHAEWFRATKKLQAHAREIRDIHGDPLEVARRISAARAQVESLQTLGGKSE